MGHNMDSGKWIRELREDRFVKSSDIERVSRSIADIKGNADFYVSHSTLADIETGSVPSIHKLFSLAACLKISLDELLLGFGIDHSEVRQFAGPLEPGPHRPETSEAREPSFRFQLNFDTRFDSRETSLLKLDAQELAALPPALRKRLDPRRYRYAVVGLKDDTMGDVRLGHHARTPGLPGLAHGRAQLLLVSTGRQGTDIVALPALPPTGSTLQSATGGLRHRPRRQCLASLRAADQRRSHPLELHSRPSPPRSAAPRFGQTVGTMNQTQASLRSPSRTGRPGPRNQWLLRFSPRPCGSSRRPLR